MKYTEDDMKEMLRRFLRDGCPNHPKDSRGSWIKWFDNYIASLKRDCI